MVLPQYSIKGLMATTILSFQNSVVIEHNDGRSLRYIANYLDFSTSELHRLNGQYQGLSRL